MRHFLPSTLAITTLTLGMGKATPARCPVALIGLSAGLTAGGFRAPLAAVEVAPVAVAADHHLAATTGTVEQTRAALHRLLLPMRAGLEPNPERYFPVGRAPHGLGARHRGDCGGQDRCRAFLNGSDDLTDSARPVTYFDSPPAPNTLLPPFHRQVFTTLVGDSPRHSPNKRRFVEPSTNVQSKHDLLAIRAMVLVVTMDNSHRSVVFLVVSADEGHAGRIVMDLVGFQAMDSNRSGTQLDQEARAVGSGSKGGDRLSGIG